MTTKPLQVATLNPPLNVTLVKDLEGLRKVEDFFSRVTAFGFDCETNITDTFYHRKVRTIQVGDRNEQYVIDLLGFAGSEVGLLQQGNKTAPEWAKPVVDTLKKGLESDDILKVGVNLQFDYEALRWCLDLRTRNFYDCMLAEKVVYCGLISFWDDSTWGMADMVRKYCGLEIDKSLQKSFDLSSELTEDQIAYAALDTRLPFSVKNGQTPAITKGGLELAVYIENVAIPAFGDMHLNGMYLDEQMWLDQLAKVKLQNVIDLENLDNIFIKAVGSGTESPVSKEALDSLEVCWKSCADREQRAEYRKSHAAARSLITAWKKKQETFTGRAAINYNAPAQVKSALAKLGVVVEDTNDKTLDTVDHPAVNALRAYRKTAQLIKNFGLKFLDHIDADTGRVHPKINQLGAETGRTSSASPNCQNIPKDAAYRNCFRARPGYVFIGRDYDGCELRIMAEESGEESWIVAFNLGQDVHSICAEMMYGQEWTDAAEEGCQFVAFKLKCDCKGHKKLRDAVKAVNFGIPYGTGYKSLALRLRISEEAAKALLELHALKFPKLHAYLKRSGENSKQRLEARTLSGRRRLFTKPEWDECRKIALENLLEKNKKSKKPRDPNSLNSRDISRIYYGKFGDIEREGKNMPIQGLNGDMIKLAFGMMWHDLEPVYGGLLVNTVHDEINLEAPKEKAAECSAFVGKIMEQAGARFVKLMVMTSAGVIADCWQKG